MKIYLITLFLIILFVCIYNKEKFELAPRPVPPVPANLHNQDWYNRYRHNWWNYPTFQNVCDPHLIVSDTMGNPVCCNNGVIIHDSLKDERVCCNRWYVQQDHNGNFYCV